nr:4'-phosphopantetheinyl transferase superfamily protein [Roseibium marinum]
MRPTDAARYRAGRTWVRRKISTELGVPSSDLAITAGPHGKPGLPGDPIGFNVTHSDEEIWLAISAGPVGIDLEPPPRDDPVPLFRQIAAPGEWRQAHAEGITAERFLLLWTAKESVLKLLGTGLMTDPRTISLGSLTATGPVTGKIAGRWISLQRLPAPAGAVAHVATFGKRLEIRLYDYECPEIS